LAWYKLFLATGPEKQHPKLVLKFWGLPPNKFEEGVKVSKFSIQTGLAQGSGVIVTSNFYKW